MDRSAPLDALSHREHDGFVSVWLNAGRRICAAPTQAPIAPLQGFALLGADATDPFGCGLAGPGRVL